MGRWTRVTRADGTTFERWSPTVENEPLPAWGPGTALLGCPICGQEYQQRAVARLLADEPARERVLQDTRSSPFAIARPGADPWEGAAVPWRYYIEHDQTFHRMQSPLAETPLERPTRPANERDVDAPQPIQMQLQRTLDRLNEERI